MVERVILIILDSLGIGAMPDAGKYNDDGANTLLHVYQKTGLNIPNLCSLGLGNLVDISCKTENPRGFWGRMHQTSPGKDTITGHWELAGVPLDFSFPVYPDGFPDFLIEKFEKSIGRKTIGNRAASGTEIIKELGELHIETAYPIVYTSADSVFQIAAHEEVLDHRRLYEYCKKARQILTGDNAVARVIARPFFGKKGKFKRNGAARKDYALPPPADTLLQRVSSSGMFVTGIGKIGDIFAHRGLTSEIKSKDNMDGVYKTAREIKRQKKEKGLIIANLVEFDSLYGHRRDTKGYAKALKEFDEKFKEILSLLDENELLMITADHGCDPEHKRHTDHTREFVPLLLYGSSFPETSYLGGDIKFSDCGQTIADFLGVEKLEHGKSLRKRIIKK